MSRDHVLLPLLLGLTFAVGLAGFAGPALSKGLKLGTSQSNRMDIFANQAALLDGRLSEQYDDSDRLQPKPAVEDDPAVTYRGKYKGEYLDHAREAARRHDVPEDMFLKLVQQESGWNPGAVSPKGATGLAQLMPGTAARLGVDIDDPIENLDGGARYLKMMFDRFGSWRLALAAYNAGPEAVEKYGGIPPYAETENYVAAILG